MPKNPNDYQKYKAYYLKREASPTGEKKRVERQRARRTAIKEGRLSGKDDPREVDHKKPLAKGGSAGMKNIQVISRTANRRKYDH